ncbi:hypothetical protein [Wolbachia endosymbiont of Ctenocephalides felis wCfeT]|uniref:hypothetical protein n=1 Tax=Wolbachia endosymbiont of Ctenocephalides felis wCfeT TaxID=2732593 RepID=UPI0014469D4A|nr:hypothetical protein [Wolbachia endosymbiont of Ctenocephalides felis wCfeT]
MDSGLSGSPLSSASLEEEPLEQEEVDNIIYYESDHEDLPKIVGSYIELDSGLPGSPLSGASLSEEPLESEEEIDNIINYHELDHKDLSKTADSCDELDPGLPGSSSTCALSQPTEPSGDWEDLDPTLLDLPLDDDSLVDEASLAEGLLELEDELNLNTFCGISPEDMEEIVDKSPIILQPLNDDEQDIHLPESGEFNIKEYLVDETDVEEIAPEPVAKRQRIEEDLKIEQAAAKRQRTV